MTERQRKEIFERDMCLRRHYSKSNRVFKLVFTRERERENAKKIL